MATIAKRVKVLREKAEMNQTELAKASGVPQTTISRIESGKVEQLRSETLIRLAEALKVPGDYLVGRANSLTPEDVFRSDSEAEILLRGYGNLSLKARQQVRDFVRFLEKREDSEGVN